MMEISLHYLQANHISREHSKEHVAIVDNKALKQLIVMKGWQIKRTRKQDKVDLSLIRTEDQSGNKTTNKERNNLTYLR